VELITAVPTVPHRRWWRGFDLAEDFGRQLAERLGVPFHRTLRKRWWFHQQSGRTKTERRKLPRSAISVRKDLNLRGRIVLLVDDVWTTGTTLLRCAQALQHAGSSETRVLTLFRAL
jgi:predicted amidophosphoribosyltransferase